MRDDQERFGLDAALKQENRMPRTASPILLIVAVVALVLIGAGAAAITAQVAERDPGGISTEALSRCAGIAGREIREADASFGALLLDGHPWLSAQHDQEAVAIGSTGTLRRRDDTTVPFRFLCVLDDKGRASMFRIVATGVNEALSSSGSISGVAAPAGLVAPLARGMELRIQLFDVTTDPKGALLTEQVVRSGWQVPIAFALRMPPDVALEGRQLAIAARIVLARETIYRMAQPRLLRPNELRQPLVLELLPEQRPTGAR
jgi:uncharacterized lipoprotein YbaY